MFARTVVASGLVVVLMMPAGAASAGDFGGGRAQTSGQLSEAITFGANLGTTAYQPEYTCAQLAISWSRPASSCMVSYIGTYPNTLSPPASGTATAVRVRAGSVGGPMRINVIRFLFQQTGDPAHPLSAGPFLEAYGPQFTAAANSVTTVPVNLPMTVTGAPDPSDTTTIQVIDVLALELLNANMTVPVFASPGVLSYPSLPGPTSLGTPAPSPNTLQTFMTVGSGVMMNADFTAGTPAGTTPGGTTPGGTPPGGTTPGGTTPGATAPTLTLPGNPLTVRNGRVGIPVNCVGAACDGVLTLGPRVAATAGKAKVYGKHSFSIPAGSNMSVKVRLTKAGRKALRAHKKLPVTATVRFSGGQTQTAALTLKRK